MAKWIFLSTPCLTCLIFLASAALSRQLRQQASATHSTTPTQFSPGPQSPGDEVLDGGRLLARVCNSVRQARWLKTNIWQRLHAQEAGFESEATLLLGPNQCARLEMNVHTADQSCRTLVVSDGRTFAESRGFAGAAAEITVRHLPPADAAAAREQFLRRHGCAGLLPLLVELKSGGSAWRVQAGTWRGTRVLRLDGELPAGRGDADAVPAADRVRVYFDAAALLPVRLEWLIGADPAHSQLLLEMEYRGLELNRPLSAEQCARAFTFEKGPRHGPVFP